MASWNYSYDGAGRLSSISNSFSETTGFTYDGEGKLLTQSNANGTSRAITYDDARGWPTNLEEQLSGTDFASYALTYDGGSNTVGNLTGVTELDTSTVTYGYDALYRLTSETRTGTNPYSKTYDYDLANNLTTVNGSAFATYDTANKFSTITGGTKSYTAGGNLTSATYSGFSTNNFFYDGRSKVTQVNVRGNLYNAEGLRGAAKLVSPPSQPYTFYIYDGDTVIGEINTSTGATAAYTWGPGGIVSERILSGTPKSLWYHFGPQGEVRQLTNSSGTVADTYRYTAYGNPLGTTGTDTNPFQYGGKFGYYTDSNITAAVLAGQRWYSPGLYRWMTRDPILYDGGDNQYSYVQDNPVLWVDPEGLSKWYPVDGQSGWEVRRDGPKNGLGTYHEHYRYRGRKVARKVDTATGEQERHGSGENRDVPKNVIEAAHKMLDVTGQCSIDTRLLEGLETVHDVLTRINGVLPRPFLLPVPGLAPGWVPPGFVPPTVVVP